MDLLNPKKRRSIKLTPKARLTTAKVGHCGRLTHCGRLSHCGR